MRNLLGFLSRRLLQVAAVMVMWLPLASSPVAAQGLFDFLFGAAGPKQQAPPLASSPRANPSPIVLHGSTDYRPSTRSEPSDRPPAQLSRGRYRTVCVRLCDGYYWPISQNAARSEFYRDAEACRSACDNEARLFFAPSPGADIAQARDQRGLAYTSLDTAFLYRKTRVAGCVCKPVPWSAKELGRHRGYAAEEAALKRAADLSQSDKDAGDKRADEGAAEPAIEVATMPPLAAIGPPQFGPPAPAETPVLLAPVLPVAGSIEPDPMAVQRSAGPAPPTPAADGSHHVEPAPIGGASASISLMSLSGSGAGALWSRAR